MGSACVRGEGEGGEGRILEAAVRTVPVVYVPIDDQDPLCPQSLARVGGCHRDRVEDAETHRLVRLCLEGGEGGIDYRLRRTSLGTGGRSQRAEAEESSLEALSRPGWGGGGGMVGRVTSGVDLWCKGGRTSERKGRDICAAQAGAVLL